MDGRNGRRTRGAGRQSQWSRPIQSSSRKIRDAVRWSRRFRGQSSWTGGPLQWTTSRLRMDFDGELYVADTEDQGFGLDPAMLCPDSEVQHSPDSDGSHPAMSCPESETQLCPDSEPMVGKDGGWVIGETPEDELVAAEVQEVAAIDGSATDTMEEQLPADEEHKASRLGKLRLDIGGEDHDTESGKKIGGHTGNTSISDAETDDKGMRISDEHGSDVRGHS